tara:strand:- start:1258 stop:1833 length:576 start_codon:yes stop_codon:yes gene_type:complete
MACTALIHGRGLDCSRISGGIKNIYFAVYDQISSFAYDVTLPAEIDTIDFGSNDIYKYVMPLGVSSLTDTIVGSRENGTIYYTPTVSIILNKLTTIDQNEVKLLGATKTVIFAELNQTLANGHNVIAVLGIGNGMQLNAGTMDSGAAWGDRNGYSLNFDGMEATPFAMLEDYTTAPFDNSGITNLGAIVTS